MKHFIDHILINESFPLKGSESWIRKTVGINKIKCMWTNNVQDLVHLDGNSSVAVCRREFDYVSDLATHMDEFHLDFDVRPPYICQWHRLVIILYGPQ